MEKVIYDNLEKMEEKEINIYYNKLTNINTQKREIMKILIESKKIEIKTKEEIEKFFKKISIISNENNLGSREWRIIEIENKLIINNCMTKYHYRINKKLIENIEEILRRNKINYKLQILKNNRFYKTLQINFIFIF
jgi:hypothetical protein